MSSTSATGESGPAEPDAIQQLDLTAEAADPQRVSPETKSIQQQREDTRKVVALSLLVALGVVVVAWAAVALWASGEGAERSVDAFRTVFTGVLGLTGTVVGFYFGGASGGGGGGGEDR